MLETDSPLTIISGQTLDVVKFDRIFGKVIMMTFLALLNSHG